MNVETNQRAPAPLMGRPAKHDYEALRDEIQQLINEGHGIGRLSKRYGLSYKWMRHILAKLGLRTLGQPQRSEVA